MVAALSETRYAEVGEIAEVREIAEVESGMKHELALQLKRKLLVSFQDCRTASVTAQCHSHFLCQTINMQLLSVPTHPQ